MSTFHEQVRKLTEEKEELKQQVNIYTYLFNMKTAIVSPQSCCGVAMEELLMRC